MRRAAWISALLTLSACGPALRDPPPDGGPLPTDSGTETPDAPVTPTDGGASELDGGPADLDAAVPPSTDAGPRPDAGAGDPRVTTPAPAPTVLRAGSGGVLLRGTVLTPLGPLVGGEVLVVGNTITCVSTDCSGVPMAGSVTVIDTHAVISPGLIDGHNHLSYDFLGEWVPSPPRLFLNRYQWRGDASYGAWVDPEGDSNNDGTQDNGAICPGSKWGELRSIVHGTTTLQGQSPPNTRCLDRLARNADQYHGIAGLSDFARTTISGPCESGFPTRTSLLGDFTGGTTTRFFVHMAEGYDRSGTATRTDPLREFDCYAGRDTLYPADSLLFDAAGMPYGTGVFIHAVPFTDAQLDESLRANVRFVWSPSSNLVLYGHTAPIATMLARGVTVGMGPDWTPSGEDEMLGEMRVGLEYGETMGIDALTPRRIWEMATSDGAEVVGLAEHLGTIEVGRRADLVVFGRTGADPYRAVLDSRAGDVRLVLIDGAGYYGDLALEATTAVNGSCDMIDACGDTRYLCVANTPGNADRAGDTLMGLETELRGILGSYGRSDLEPLIDPIDDCSPPATP